MTTSAIAAALALVESLLTLIPQWIAQAKAKGELSAEQEADFQRRQAKVFAQSYAQPDPPVSGALQPFPDATKPFV